ncbi:MAG: peptidyl-prolyl cis-trans isomerase [Acidobacteria bacterium]|nr:peptidyl-prolyl cis-trans isomerase [Acidobacteriota bacterium]
METIGLAVAKRSILTLLVGGLMIAPGQAQQAAAGEPSAATSAKAPASAASEKIVLKAGADQVTEEDFNFVVGNLPQQVQQALATQGRRPIGEEYALMLLLSQQAVAHQLDSSAELRRRLAFQRIQWLAEAEVEYIESHVEITSQEITAHYAANPTSFDETQIRQVVVRKKPQGAAEGTPGLSSQDAKARAEAIRAALAGGKDFKAVTEEFQKPNEVFVGVEPRPIRRGQLPPELDAAVFQLKDGELSQPLDNAQAFIIVQKLGTRRLEVKDVTEEIEGQLRRQKVEASLADLRSKAAVWMDEEYFAAPAPSVAPANQAPPPSSPPTQE